MMKHVTITLVALTLLFGSIGMVRADQLGVDVTQINLNGGSSVWNLGFEFHANSNSTVTGLGNYDLGGVNFPQAQQIGLWTASGTLLASTFVDNSDPIVSGHWRFHSITPVALVAGQNYVVGGQGGANYVDGTITVNPNITYIEDRFTFLGNTSNNPLVMPTTTDNLTTTALAGFFGGNVEFGEAPSAVPEPATLTMLGFGVVSLVGYGWRRRKQAARVAG